MMNLILLGAPGAGKGTQADIISDKLQIPVIGTGNIIRKAISEGTEIGLLAKDYMDKGLLVPDETIIGIIKERLQQDDCKNGFILDGVPRTVGQAEALEAMNVTITKAVNLEVKDEEIIQRLSGRRVCGDCGTPYHTVSNPSAKADTCDKCNGGLIVRKDDQPQTIKDRLHVYHEQTEPLIDFYTSKGILTTLDGSKNLEETTALILKALEE